jgi:hypothetical protein
MYPRSNETRILQLVQISASSSTIYQVLLADPEGVPADAQA